MAETKGMLKTCDRCGETIFLKVLGGREMDAGITRWDEFEPFPIGWDMRNDIGTLCSKCSEGYKNLLKSFMERVKEEDNRLHAVGCIKEED